MIFKFCNYISGALNGLKVEHMHGHAESNSELKSLELDNQCMLLIPHVSFLYALMSLDSPKSQNSTVIQNSAPEASVSG